MNEQQLKDHDIITKVETKLDLILIQVTKTNGRVTGLEGWRNYIGGGIALFCLVGLPLLWMLITDVRVDSDLIKTHIAQTIK